MKMGEHVDGHEMWDRDRESETNRNNTHNALYTEYTAPQTDWTTTSTTRIDCACSPLMETEITRAHADVHFHR